MNTNKVQSTRRDYSHNWCTPLYTKYRWNIQQFSERFDIRFTTRHFAVSFGWLWSTCTRYVFLSCFTLWSSDSLVLFWMAQQLVVTNVWWQTVSFKSHWLRAMYQIQRRVFDCISEPLKKRLEIRSVGQGLLGTYNVKGTHSFKCLVDCETSGGSGPVKSSHVGFLACYPSWSDSYKILLIPTRNSRRLKIPVFGVRLRVNYL